MAGRSVAVTGILRPLRVLEVAGLCGTSEMGVSKRIHISHLSGVGSHPGCTVCRWSLFWAVAFPDRRAGVFELMTKVVSRAVEASFGALLAARAFFVALFDSRG